MVNGQGYEGATSRASARTTVLLFLFGALLTALYWRIVPDMVRQWWDDPNYSHGFLVPFFSGYLVWAGRDRLRVLLSRSPSPSPFPPKGRGEHRGSGAGLLVLLAGLGMLILGDVGAENWLMRSSLIVILAGLVLFHLGSSVLRQLSFPLVFLLFMVPLPAILFYAVTFPLQNLAAHNAAWTLDLFGIPVLLDGNVLHLSRITLGVTEACSGVRSLISLLALAMAWAYITLDSRWAMAVLVASALPITIAANAARIVSTGLIGQWFGASYAQGFFHSFSGWLIFLVAFVALLAVHGLIRLVGLVRPWRTA
ncbi:MAG: exosortase [Candidatus Methylomirabilota bacterium]|nr:MAG: exosortase [candidate division NC10 bacterium]